MCRLRLYERMAAWLLGAVALAGLSGTASASSTSVSAGPASATVLNDSPVTMSFPLERTGELSYDNWVPYRTEDDTAIARRVPPPPAPSPPAPPPPRGAPQLSRRGRRKRGWASRFDRHQRRRRHPLG